MPGFGELAKAAGGTLGRKARSRGPRTLGEPTIPGPHGAEKQKTIDHSGDRPGGNALVAQEIQGVKHVAKPADLLEQLPKGRNSRRGRAA